MKLAFLCDMHRGFNNNTHIVHRKFYKRLKESHSDLYCLYFCGDSISHDQRQWKSFIKSVDEFFPEEYKEICLGNHDFWRNRYYVNNLKYLEELRKELKLWEWEFPRGKYETIAHINKNFISLNITNWYYNPDEAEKKFQDRSMMNLDDYLFLKRKNTIVLDSVLSQLKVVEDSKEPKILISHFGPEPDFNEDYMDYAEALEKAGLDYWVSGHTHRYHNFKIGNLTCLNPGSDYNNPKYIILDTKTKETVRGE